MGSDESGNVIESKSEESLGFKEDAQPSSSVVDDAKPAESAGAKTTVADTQPAEEKSESNNDDSLGFKEDACPSEPVADKAEPSESAVPKAAASDSASQPSAAASEAAEAAAQQKPVFLAGRRFNNRAELVEHVRKIQEKFADADGSKGELSNSDNLFIFHLLLHHPKAVEKMTAPISHFRYGVYDKFLNKCFISVGIDGSQEGVSAMKSVDMVFPKSGAKVEGTAGLVASNTDRGTKREREPKAPPERRPFEPQEMIKGVVIDIKGLPHSPHYHRLKEQLSSFGPVRWLSFLKAPKAENQERPAKKAKTETSGEVEGGDEDDEEEQEEEEVEEDEEESPTGARCRFETPEAAKAAIAGLKDAEVQGAKVETVLLEGAEEEAFWDETNKKLKDAYENPKPKGKGSDKGKKKGKSKGKSKGGKGKKKDGGLKMIE
eukprot:TRINITY_DN33765_c0_g1_i1.p1 TRINITY_DN33765_c0_g1~~TRINITY_DN33765_c0_g1_i1.p1  ORF type:complete len:434 (+),score=117.93 TRINITY_DN33765_c0_g1_i1:86-1387(+)